MFLYEYGANRNVTTAFLMNEAVSTFSKQSIFITAQYSFMFSFIFLQLKENKCKEQVRSKQEPEQTEYRIVSKVSKRVLKELTTKLWQKDRETLN